MGSWGDMKGGHIGPSLARRGSCLVSPACRFDIGKVGAGLGGGEGRMLGLGPLRFLRGCRRRTGALWAVACIPGILCAHPGTTRQKARWLGLGFLLEACGTRAGACLRLCWTREEICGVL